MIGFVVISHGRLASELLRAAEIIVGPLDGSAAVDISPEMGMDEIHGAIDEAIRATDRGSGVVLLTDMFGGTPSNVGLSYLGTGTVEVVTGVNLPMLLKIPSVRQSADVPALARQLLECGRESISIPGDMLRRKAERG
jgi:PTS system mannose-specific IIA component